MNKEKETWTIRRHISPEPASHKLDKLNLMQENLAMAAETINALKLERDKLKSSLRTVLDENFMETEEDSNISRCSGRKSQAEARKKQALKEELLKLKKVSIEKDKMIEIMEKKLQDSRIEKSEWRILNEKHTSVKVELEDKKRCVQMLEKKLAEYKNEQKDWRRMSEFNEQAGKNSVIESQAMTIKELSHEKAQWKKIYDFLVGLAPEYLDHEKYMKFKEAETNRYDWQKFTDVIIALRTQNNDKDKIIESLSRKPKGDQLIIEKSEWVQLKEANKLLKHELESAVLARKHENYSLYQELRDAASEVIDRMHSNASWHSLFKSKFVCSKRFRSMIENHEFSEALLKTMLLLLDILDEPKSSLASTKPISVGFDSPKSSQFKNSPRKMSETHHRLECWTQTPGEGNFSCKSQPLRTTDLEESRANKGTQYELDSIRSEEKPQISRKLIFGPLQVNKAIQVTNPSMITHVSPRSINISEEKPPAPSLITITPQQYPKNISAKDPASVHKIHPTGPNKRTPQPQTSNFIKIIKSSEDLSENLTPKLKQDSSPKADEEYLKLIDESQQLLSIIDKQNSRLAKINTQISQLVPTSAEPIESRIENEENLSRSRIEKHREEGLRHNEDYRFIAGKDFERFSDDGDVYGEQSSSPKNGRKRSGWDFSALRIPEKEPVAKKPEVDIKRAVSPKREISHVELKKRHGRSISPDINTDRFKGYTRPMLREEGCWGSVADFFGGHHTVEKSKDMSPPVV